MSRRGWIAPARRSANEEALASDAGIERGEIYSYTLIVVRLRVRVHMCSLRATAPSRRCRGYESYVTERCAQGSGR